MHHFKSRNTNIKQSSHPLINSQELHQAFYIYSQKTTTYTRKFIRLTVLRFPPLGWKISKMVGTRSSIEGSQRRFQTILMEKLGIEVHSVIHQELSQESIITLSDLVTLSGRDIEALEYTVTVEVDEDQVTTTTSKISKGNRV